SRQSESGLSGDKCMSFRSAGFRPAALGGAALAGMVALVLALSGSVAVAQDAAPAASAPAPAAGEQAAATPAGAASAAQPAAPAETAVAKAGDAAAGAGKAAVCGACHGADGNSTDAQYPKLAGQSEAYIVRQLSHFKSGQRQNPIMMGMAAP